MTIIEFPSLHCDVKPEGPSEFSVVLNSKVALDLSDRHDTGQTLRLLNARLNQRISENALELRSLRQQVLEAAAEEDRRLGFELHDNIQQQLAGLGMLAQCLADRLATRSSAEAESARQLAFGIGETSKEVHRLASGLIPIEIDAHKLIVAMSDLSAKVQAQHGIICRFQFRGNIEFENSFFATHLYRISQEAVNNAIKHAHASQIDILLVNDYGSITLTVQDNGCGINPSRDFSQGIGLRTMKYRADLINGSLYLTPGKIKGTVVTCTAEREWGSI